MNKVKTSQKKLILVIDDDSSIREAVKDVLMEEGYEVACAENGEDGLKCLESVRPDLIILDTRMPVMDGWSFKTKMAQDPNIKNIPVFIFTANYSIPPGLEATGFLNKPIDLDELLEKIRPFLS